MHITVREIIDRQTERRKYNGERGEREVPKLRKNGREKGWQTSREGRKGKRRREDEREESKGRIQQEREGRERGRQARREEERVGKKQVRKGTKMVDRGQSHAKYHTSSLSVSVSAFLFERGRHK